MFKHSKQILGYSLLYMLTIGVVASYIHTVIAAVPNTLTIAPGSGTTYRVGDTFTATANVTVNALYPFEFAYTSKGTFTYPANLLRLNSVSSANNSFFKISSASGQIGFNAYFVNGGGALVKNTNLNLFTANFTVIGSGNASLALAPGATILNQAKAAQSSTYTLYPRSCPAGQIGTPPNCTTPPPPPPPAPAPAPTPAPAPKPAPRPPVRATVPAPNVQAVGSTDPTAQPEASATPPSEDPTNPTESQASTPPDAVKFSIGSVQTSALYDTIQIAGAVSSKAKVTLKYGTTQDKYDSNATVTLNDDGAIFTSKIERLQPGTKYFFIVAAVDESGNTTEYKGAFTTKGYPVKLIVQKNNSAYGGATVSFKGLNGNYTTDDSGIASLNMRDGKYTAVITKDDVTDEQKITVKAVAFKAGTVPDTQDIEITIANSGSSLFGLIAAIVGGIVLLLGLLVGLFIFLKKRKERAAETMGYQSVIEDDFSVAPETPVSSDYSPYGTAAQNISDGGTAAAAYYQYPTSSPEGGYAQNYYTDQYIDPNLQSPQPMQDPAYSQPVYPEYGFEQSTVNAPYPEQPVSDPSQQPAWQQETTYGPSADAEPQTYNASPVETPLSTAEPTASLPVPADYTRQAYDKSNDPSYSYKDDDTLEIHHDR